MFGKRRKMQKYLASAVTAKDLHILLWDGKLTEDSATLFLERANELVKNLDEALALAECATNENFHLRYRMLNLFLDNFGFGTNEQFMKLLDVIFPDANLKERVHANVFAERARHDSEAFNEVTNYSFANLMRYVELLHPESKEKVFLQHAVENARLAVLRRKQTRKDQDIVSFCRYSGLPRLIKANVLVGYILEGLPLSESDWKELMCMLTEQVPYFPRETHRCILATLLEHKPDQ